jgi:8-oxo-dGTP pyrophosphatase MutT (NUDIX family)
MRILAEIDRQPNVSHTGKFVCREAVRAIILQGTKALLVHSSVNGDYKFPGGGMEHGECQADALKREVAEESGGRVRSKPVPYGKVLEFDTPIEREYDSFCMTSYYYLCEIDPVLGEQCLDEYEARLGFTPVWVELDDAIANNSSLLTSGKKVERWVRRETLVLELVRTELTK